MVENIIKMLHEIIPAFGQQLTHGKFCLAEAVAGQHGMFVDFVYFSIGYFKFFIFYCLDIS
ncbi:MAG: hypothetical protein GQ559_08350 [Desulfobulbaceae bacterium]|nr:hypothetical protein [Desulfobulbaceae bacterium]